MRDRVAFARAHLRDSWDERWFFGESYFNLYRHGNRYWVGTGTDDAMELPKLTTAQEKISLGSAVAVCKGHKSALAFPPKNWKGADLVTAFRDTLYPSMRGASRSAAEMQLIIDNDGRHFEAPWKAYVAQRRISELRPWPSNSPDFNIEENVFAWMKSFVEDLEPYDEASLREAITRAWEAVEIEKIDSLVASMPKRLCQCLVREGDRTSY